MARQSRHLEPDYAHLHSELKRPGVTLQLLWEEYQQQHQVGAYKYSAFCEKYQQWTKRMKHSMRQTHEAGDKLFVEYAGQMVPVVDASTGEITQANPSPPLGKSIPEQFVGDILSPAYASNLTRLVGRSKLWVHGHVHDHVDYMTGMTRVVCNLRGYPDVRGNPTNETFDPTLILTM